MVVSKIKIMDIIEESKDEDDNKILKLNVDSEELLKLPKKKLRCLLAMGLRADDYKSVLRVYSSKR